MRLQCQSNGMLIEFNPASELGVGGEARVFLAPPDGRRVGKVYHKPGESYAAKLAVMIANPPDDPMTAQEHVSIAWPQDLLCTLEPGENSTSVVGFLMPRAEGTRPLYDYYNPRIRLRRCPLFNYYYLLRTARNLAAAVHAIHARGYVVGDINESNVLVTDTALVTVVDTDSFQVRDPQTGRVYRCPVGKPDFTPAELQGETFREVDRTPEHDRFGLAVLLFLLLMEGTHPFAGSYTGAGDPPPYAERIRLGHFPYGSRPVPYRPMSIAPPYDLLPPSLRELFLRSFEDGHDDPGARPTALEWVTALTEAEEAITVCSVNDQHRYGHHLSACPWCERQLRLAGRDPFPSREAVHRGDFAPPDKTASLKAHTYVLPIARKSGRGFEVRGRQAGGGRRLALWMGGTATLMLVGIGLFAMVTGRTRRQEAWEAVEAARLQLRVLAQEETQFQIGAIRTENAEAAIQELKRMGEAARQHVQRALALDNGSPDAKAAKDEVESSLRRIEADSEAQAARVLLDTVVNSVGNTPVSVPNGSRDRETIVAALKHCAAALRLEPRNRLAWLQRVRALRLSGDGQALMNAARQALALFPEDAEMKGEAGNASP